MERLSDLDELVLRCRNDQAKAYIFEAVSSYKVGAYRAAISSTWVAVIYDIIDKIGEIAATGDKGAISFKKELEDIQTEIHKGSPNGIQRSLKLEREIIDLAKDKFHLIDQIQSDDLSRLREDRNRSAHPTYHLAGTLYTPSPELARLHIRNSIVHLLSQPPIMGKPAVDALLNNVASEFFPTDFEQAKTSLLENGFSRPSPAMINNFIDGLVFGVVDPGSRFFKKVRAHVAITAAVALRPEIAQPRLVRNINKIANAAPNEISLLNITLVIFGSPQLWDECTGATKTTITIFIEKCNLQSLHTLTLAPRVVPQIDAAIISRIDNIHDDDLSKLIAKKADRKFIKRSVDLFCQSNNWITAGHRYSNLIQPLLHLMTQDNFIHIINSAAHGHNDLAGSHAFREALKSAIALGVIPKGEMDKILREAKLEADRLTIKDMFG